MDKYYYHGIEPYGGYGYYIELMIKILSEGLKKRNDVRRFDEDKYNHICLYKKNDNYDYTDERVFLKSARAGWIEHCFVFVISPEIEAEKVEVRDTTGFDDDGKPFTNLIDEWRSKGDIPTSKIVGIAIPYDDIKEYISKEYSYGEIYDDIKKIEKLLPVLEEYAESLGLFIVNSNTPYFTDELYANLKKSKFGK